MKIEIGGALLNVTSSGNAVRPPVVLVHGFPFSHVMWHHQIRALADEFFAIAYDVRGLGESSSGDGVITIERHVDDLLALLDHFHIQRAALVGLSMGGYIALRALERNPQRFAAAVLCDTRSEADSNEARLNRAQSIPEVLARGSATFAQNFLPKIFAPGSFQRVPEEVTLIRDVISHTPPLAIAQTLLALAARTDTTAALPLMTTPTVILVGEHDVITPPDAAQTMHRLIPGSRLHVIPDAAHMSPLENPQQVNRLLLEFLRTTYK